MLVVDIIVLRTTGEKSHTVWRFRLGKIASEDQTIMVPKLIAETPGEYFSAVLAMGHQITAS
jgi:hypothetical protein